jgi:hypothetical protein
MTLDMAGPTAAAVNKIWPKTETDIVRALATEVRREWPVSAMGIEVRSHGRCRTDLCLRTSAQANDGSPNILIGIEAKMTDWRRALRQAILNRHAVHVSMVAVPSQRGSAELVCLAREYGVGVLAVTKTSLTILSFGVVGAPDAILLRKMNEQLQPVRRLRPRLQSGPGRF